MMSAGNYFVLSFAGLAFFIQVFFCLIDQRKKKENQNNEDLTYPFPMTVLESIVCSATED